MSPSAQHLLLADIGGTNVRFAWVDTPTSEIQDVHQYACADFPTLADAIDQYASKCRVQRFESAALGIATAVAGDRVDMTNHHWSFSQVGLRSRFAWNRLVVLNDFTALALSLPTLRDEDRMQLGEGRVAQPNQPIALLGAGTGLGMSGLLPYDRQRWVPISGEGGHATLSPNSDLECEVVQILRREFGHVSAERALSGPGLVNLYRAACAMNRLPTEALTPADVLLKGQTGKNEACVTAVDLFCAFLAGSAGNLALSLGARGGVYIGGGIAPRLLDRLQQPNFREAFERKGRFGEYLRDIPVWVITTPESPALRGAALALMPTHE